MKLDKILILLVLGTMPAAFGSIYVSDFSGANFDDPLTGVDGWAQSITDLPPDSNGELSPYSWIQRCGSDTNPGKSAAIGTYYASPDNEASYYVNHAIANEPLIGSTLTMKFSITDSTNGFPARNDFSIGLLNGNGTDLFTLHFLATSQTADPESETNSQWNMKWSSNGSTSSAFAGVLEGGAYTYDVSFDVGLNQSDVDATFTVTNDNGSFYSGTVPLTGLANETISDLRVQTDKGSGNDWGDNFLCFHGVPEPSAAMLLLLSAVGLLRRRR